MADPLHTAFSLGLLIGDQTQHLPNKRSQERADAVRALLEKVASGELTLLNTPEEMMADVPPPPPELLAKAPEAVREMISRLSNEMPDVVRQAMREQRDMAAKLVTMIP